MKSIQQLMNLTGRGAFITGGAGHIGEAGAQSLLELGCKVAIVDINAEVCQKKVDELNAKGYPAKAYAIVCDVADEQQLRRAVDEAAKVMGCLDILVHSAAFVGTTKFPGWVVPFDQQAVAAWDACMKVNLTAAFIMVQQAQPYLVKGGHGSVILISSIHGMVGPDMSLYEGTGMGNPAAYGASKAALIQLARYWATLFGPTIRTNCISPGGVWRNQAPLFHERYLKRTPFNRMATEEDLKGAIAYLASDLSNYVSGQNLVVDGGYVAW